MREPSPYLSAFARTLRRQRRKQDLSQEALADASGVSAKHIGEIERENKEPGITTALRLVDGLEEPLGEFFTRVEDRLRGG
ncbi:helix-turn-helix domain-containing protein [Conexibacter woesei]|uniref:Transcriptional regulator, XRE family n=1 Tax=Conexibacter woesei (strain DSM 14684 / CCUG 47730 / CIP 108061 / JCM 11494 / NBRC 100937 / ID131577) TaxID=469383 RepID=D3F4J5_CONWI|nr:helix-turn-helix transcriptional regulator [Conexibacter woesei]ADB52452.1 transcriptional regulator, XRE family [Conexibacter woesei DSM 14684]